MRLFTIIVEFVIEKSATKAFLELVLVNAKTSLAEEDGCRRFDVLVPDGAGDRVLLYEIYRDRAAFDVHSSSAHYIAFARATDGMVLNKRVTVCDRLNPESEPAAP